MTTLSSAVQALDHVVSLSGIRYVRTPEGAKHYNAPIGSPIGKGQVKKWSSALAEGLDHWSRDEAATAYSEYTTGGYAKINRRLRTGESGRTDLKTARTLDALIESDGVEMEHDTVVYRGGMPGWLEVGQQVTDSAFVSTSADYAEARNFGRVNKMVLPKGMKVLPGQGGEAEVILPRDLTWTVTSVDVDENGTEQATLHLDGADYDSAPTPTAEFGSVLADPTPDAELLEGPISPEQWEEIVTVGKANSDMRYVQPGPARAKAALQYDIDVGDWVKAAAGNISRGAPPLEGIDLDAYAFGKPRWQWHTRDGYDRADFEADIAASAQWLAEQEPTDLGAVYRGLNFPVENSWDEVLDQIRTDGWNHQSVTTRSDTAEMYVGRPDRSRGVRMTIRDAKGIQIDGVGNFSHTGEGLVSGSVRIVSHKITPDPDGWGDYMDVEAQWIP